jgi:hypothetical protein
VPVSDPEQPVTVASAVDALDHKQANRLKMSNRCHYGLAIKLGVCVKPVDGWITTVLLVCAVSKR